MRALNGGSRVKQDDFRMGSQPPKLRPHRDNVFVRVGDYTLSEVSEVAKSRFRGRFGKIRTAFFYL